MSNSLQELLNLNSWFKPTPTKESFKENMGVQGTIQSAALDMLNENAEGLGTKPVSVGTPILQQEPEGLNKVVIPATYDPNNKMNVLMENANTTGIEGGAWDIYTTLTSTKDMKGLRMGLNDSFCECSSSNAEQMQQQCSNLTEYNCKRVGCCVFTSDNKCVAGNEQGPSDSLLSVDYYYYKNKCYGNNCPKNTC